MLANGFNLRPNLTGSITETIKAETVDDTPAGDAYEIKKFAGLIEAALGFEVTWDDEVNAENDFLYKATTGAGIGGLARVCYGFEGNTVAKKFVGLDAMTVTGHARNPKKGDIHRGSIEMESYGSTGIEDGRILVPLSSVTTATDGTGVDGGAAPLTATISNNTVANPTVITTAAPHAFKTGDTVLIADSNSTPSLNGTHKVTVIDTTHLTVPVNVTVAGSAGTLTYANGGAVYLQVPAVTLGGYTNWTVQLQDFTADTPASYANVAGAAAQAITASPVPTSFRIAVTGVIRRWTRLKITLTGAGAAPSLTIMGGLVRL